jgi:hypothetical protein
MQAMSVFHAPEKTQRHGPVHGFKLQEIVIFAVGVFAAMLVGIAATGVLPIA